MTISPCKILCRLGDQMGALAGFPFWLRQYQYSRMQRAPLIEQRFQLDSTSSATRIRDGIALRRAGFRRLSYTWTNPIRTEIEALGEPIPLPTSFSSHRTLIVCVSACVTYNKDYFLIYLLNAAFNLFNLRSASLRIFGLLLNPR